MGAPARTAHATDRRRLIVADATMERFEGYWLMALPLSTGHVLAFRRFTVSSVGPPFSSVWHRDPEGRWTCHVDVMPARACPRYIGPALHDVQVGAIDVVWKSRFELSVYAHAARLHMMLRLAATPATVLVTAAARMLPGVLWRRSLPLDVIGRSAGWALRAGPIALHGETPAGQRYRLRPRAIWRVEAAAVARDGRDLGEMSTLDVPAAVGSYSLTRVPIFAVGSTDYLVGGT